MNTHYASSNHLPAQISEQTYPNSIKPNYQREMYAVSDVRPGMSSDLHRRPNHLPANLECGYINDINYQPRETPGCDSPGMPPLYDLPETPMQNGYLDPELCEGISRGLDNVNIHKSNFSQTNPSKISQSWSLLKAKEDLAWRLKSRSTPEDLISKGILLGRVEQSPNILQSRKRLERAKVGDNLRKKILDRPSKGKLIDVNILKELSGSPRLHQSQMSILKKQKMQRLNEKISERPAAESLIKRGILCPPSPSLSECLHCLQNPANPMMRTVNRKMCLQDHFAPGNPDFYPPNSHSAQFNQTSPSSVHSQGCEMPRERVDQLRQEEASPREADCSILETTDTPNSALDQFTVSSKFQCQEETDTGFRRSLSKKISIRNPPTESSLKKDLSISSSLKTRSGKRPRKGIKTYKYHEYIPCNKSGNGLTKCKILEKTQLTKTASKGRHKTSVDMEVQQEQLLLQLHLLRQQYPALMPNIYNQLVTQLSQIDGKAEGAKRSYTLEEIESMTVNSLKAICKENSVPSTGKKAELLMRLRGCKGLVVDKLEQGDTPSNLDPEASTQDTGGHSPGSKSADETVKQAQSPNSHLSEQDQMNTLIASPPSVLSQYSAASSDSHASENCSSSGKGTGHVLKSESEELSKMSDRDAHNFHNEFDCVPGIDAVKYLDDSMCQIRNNPQMCMGDNSFESSQYKLERCSDEGINTNSQLYKLQSEHSISTSLPSIPHYQTKAPPLHTHNKLGVTNIAEQSEMSDLLHQLDSFNSYDMGLNRPLPAYGQRPNTQFPYTDPYYIGDLQGTYPDKPLEYLQDTHPFIDIPYSDECPSAYPLDMNMDWNTPVNLASDPYSLNDYTNYDVTPMGLEGIGRNTSLQNSVLFHNSIEHDFLQ